MNNKPYHWQFFGRNDNFICQGIGYTEHDAWLNARSDHAMLNPSEPLRGYHRSLRGNQVSDDYMAWRIQRQTEWLLHKVMAATADAARDGVCARPLELDQGQIKDIAERMINVDSIGARVLAPGQRNILVR